MKKSAKGVGLAIVGGGRVGLFRGEVAARHPSVEWIGLAEKNPNRAGEVAPRLQRDARAYYDEFAGEIEAAAAGHARVHRG